MIRVNHDHGPVYRVVRQGHRNPLDTSFSQTSADNRWNTKAFPALYCCCGIRVARAIVRDLFRFASVETSELRAGWRPKLVAIDWSGDVVDAATAKGVAAARLPADYPLNADRARTRALAVRWRDAGAQGVVARSASLSKLGVRRFTGDHAQWSELAIFVDVARNAPAISPVQPKGNWLLPADPQH